MEHPPTKLKDRHIREEQKGMPIPKEVWIMKSLNCKDVGVECDFSICAKTEKELFDKAREHARTSHNMNDIPKDLYDKARSAIRDVDRC